MVQLELARTGGWGGKRKNAGRKAAHGSRVTHAPRPVHKGRHPVHVTLRACRGLPSFRDQLIQKVVAEVLRGQRARKYAGDFRVVHYSIQDEHMHFVVEADSERAAANGTKSALRSGISGFAIAFARRLNMILRRSGKVWADRYHRHDLRTPKEVHVGLGYVLKNCFHHGWRAIGQGMVDLFSSAWLFDGWDQPPIVFPDSERWRWFVCRAKTWLASVGWRKHGRLQLAPADLP
jgi:hypothetical protein